jgi:phosphomannomutase
MIKQGIFKANDIRGITEGSDPEWDAAGAYAIGAALVEVLDLRDLQALERLIYSIALAP